MARAGPEAAAATAEAAATAATTLAVQPAAAAAVVAVEPVVAVVVQAAAQAVPRLPFSTSVLARSTSRAACRLVQRALLPVVAVVPQQQQQAEAAEVQVTTAAPVAETLAQETQDQLGLTVLLARPYASGTTAPRRAEARSPYS